MERRKMNAQVWTLRKWKKLLVNGYNFVEEKANGESTEKWENRQARREILKAGIVAEKSKLICRRNLS